VIVIVGHIVVPTNLWIETDYSPSVPLQLSIYLSVYIDPVLLLLQPVRAPWSAFAMGAPHARI